MAILDESFYNPVPGYTPDPYKRRPTPAPADVPRGGMPAPGPLGQAPAIPDEPREPYADPLSSTRSMRYGLGDQRDLSVPVIDPRDPLAPSPATWSGVVPRGSGRAAYSTNGGYAFTNAPAIPDETTPRVPFADAAGESLAATAARGARMQAEQDRLGLTTADMDYIRTYGRAAYDARQSKYAPPTTRADYLARQGQNLAISVAERNAAQQELSRIERDNEAQRRREDWALEQAARLRMAEGANAATVEAARLTAAGQIRAAQAKAAADAAAAEAAGKSKPVQLDPESPGLYVDGTFWKNPAYNPKPVTAGGNGIGRWNPDTGSWDFEWPDKGGAKKAPVTLKPGESYFDPETKETFVAPGTDRISIEAEIAGWQSAYVKTDSSKARDEIEKRIDEARKRLAALGGGEAAPATPAPAPVAAAASPAAPAEPAPGPGSAPAPAPASPTGHRRWTPGS